MATPLTADDLLPVVKSTVSSARQLDREMSGLLQAGAEILAVVPGDTPGAHTIHYRVANRPPKNCYFSRRSLSDELEDTVKLRSSPNKFRWKNFEPMWEAAPQLRKKLLGDAPGTLLHADEVAAMLLQAYRMGYEDGSIPQPTDEID